MNASARNELASIKRELNSIISELESISKGVRNDFTGIGNNKCADCIDRVLDQYYYVRRKLNNLDTTTVTESYAQSHGGDAGGSF
jgi:hypothetical protein